MSNTEGVGQFQPRTGVPVRAARHGVVVLGLDNPGISDRFDWLVSATLSGLRVPVKSPFVVPGLPKHNPGLKLSNTFGVNQLETQPTKTTITLRSCFQLNGAER